MRIILQYIHEYFYETDKRVLTIVTLFTAILVYINYQYGLDTFIRANTSFSFKLIAWYIVFGIAFAVPYTCYIVGRKLSVPRGTMILLLLIAPLLFAIKISVDPDIFPRNSDQLDRYLNMVLYWPLLCAGTTIVLYIIWYKYHREQPFYGLTGKYIRWRPYFIMLTLMIPLVALASTQPDFLETYPKLRLTETVFHPAEAAWWQKLLFELSYGSDFFTIELFFRGFLVLGFLKWAGKDAILPMACFYCTIHFGKPLGECISSYFGGMLLGIVAFHTRSILGGLLIHLGIAWLMELGGYIGNG